MYNSHYPYFGPPVPTTASDSTTRDIQEGALASSFDTTHLHQHSTGDANQYATMPQLPFPPTNVTCSNTPSVDSRYNFETLDASRRNTGTGEVSRELRVGGQSLRQAPMEQNLTKIACPICNQGKQLLFSTWYAVEGLGQAGQVENSSINFVFQKARSFKKHFESHHIALFWVKNSDKYVCGFCPCKATSRNDCNASYRGMEEFLSHICDAHSHPAKWHKPYQHPCKPTPEPAQLTTVVNNLGGHQSTLAPQSTFPANANQWAPPPAHTPHFL